MRNDKLIYEYAALAAKKTGGEPLSEEEAVRMQQIEDDLQLTGERIVQLATQAAITAN